MKFEWKRLMTLAMAIVMVFTMLPLNALAAPSNSVNFGSLFQNQESSPLAGSKRYQVTVGETLELKGSANSNRWCDYKQTWTSSDANVATVVGNGVVTGVSKGDVTITHTYCTSDSYNWWNQEWEHETSSETFAVKVVPAELTALEISGDDAVDVGATLQLTAVGATGTLYWSSSDATIITVDQNGLVTGIGPGEATVTLSVTTNAGTTTATHTITVTDPANRQAIFYYLKSPTSNPDSNETSDWGSSLGTGTVNIAGATWVKDADGNDKNCFNVANRVVTWPGDSTGSSYTVPRDSAHWNTIYNAFKTIDDLLPALDFLHFIQKEVGLSVGANSAL